MSEASVIQDDALAMAVGDDLLALPDHQQKHVTIREAAEILQVTPGGLQLAISRGKLPRAGKNAAGMTLIRTIDVLTYKHTRNLWGRNEKSSA